MLQKNVDLAPLTSFKIGGQAQAFFAVKSLPQLQAALEFARQKNLTPLVVGNMTNLLLPDEDLPLVIQFIPARAPLKLSPTNQLTVWAGETTSYLAWETLKQGWQGLEQFTSLPGSIGGAVWNNAHAGTDYLSQHLEKVQFINLTTADLEERASAALDFAYDHSWFHHHPSLITQVTFTLNPGANPATLQAAAKKVLVHRQRSQPLDQATAGCYWRNPDNTPALQHLFPEFKAQTRISAGFLIDCAGLKGQRVGSAQVSHCHAAFIINTGHATSQDVKTLAAQVKQTIFDKFAVNLQEEVAVVSPAQT